MANQDTEIPKDVPAPNVSDDQILVLVRAECSDSTEGDRSAGSFGAAMRQTAFDYIRISPDILKAQLTSFLLKMSSVLDKLPESIGEYRLEEMTLSIEITGKGGIGFLGSGGEAGGKGGLAFTLKRK